jgi:uncharacterized protein YaiI (UPF0178 family)
MQEAGRRRRMNRQNRQAIRHHALLQIFVDADACPVKDEVRRVAGRHALSVFVVSNGGIRPGAHPHFHHVTVGEGADAADDWIAEHIDECDIVVTADVPLASRCLKKLASAIGPSGRIFTEESICMALGMRELQRHLREVTGQQTIHANFTRQDRSRFLGALENEIHAIKRRIGTTANTLAG